MFKTIYKVSVIQTMDRKSANFTDYVETMPQAVEILNRFDEKDDEYRQLFSVRIERIQVQLAYPK